MHKPARLRRITKRKTKRALPTYHWLPAASSCSSPITSTFYIWCVVPIEQIDLIPLNLCCTTWIVQVFTAYAVIMNYEVTTYANLYMYATDLQSLCNPWLLAVFSRVVRRHLLHAAQCRSARQVEQWKRKRDEEMLKPHTTNFKPSTGGQIITLFTMRAPKADDAEWLLRFLFNFYKFARIVCLPFTHDLLMHNAFIHFAIHIASGTCLLCEFAGRQFAQRL